jgi:hypothetical protein
MIDTIQALARRVQRTVAGDVIEAPVFFLHVPKCGGTSVTAALSVAYGIRSGMRIDLRGNIHHSSFSWLHPVSSRIGAECLGSTLHKHREHILLYLMGLPSQKLISGHFQFSEAAYQKYHGQYTFITLIRDPVERWYSQYFYNRDKESDHFAVEDSIEEYLSSARGRSTGSLITCFFAGSDCRDGDLVQCAITNIDKFDVVGVLEELGAFKRDLSRVLGANINIPVRNTNPTPTKQKRSEITREIHRKVVEICKPDQQVYDHVVHNLLGTS